MATLTLGTRGSRLALVQSRQVAADLAAAHPGLQVKLEIISTKGDRVLDVALSAVGDKGLFVKELEQALLETRVDFCVHSCKDMPSQLPEGLDLVAFPPRADPRDAIILAPGMLAAAGELAALPKGAVVGTSSLRRASQLRAQRPDLDLRDVRGNVDTRLRKLADGHYQALILAAAGLDRLGLVRHDSSGEWVELDDWRFALVRLATTTMLPATAQGILAIEARSADAATLALLSALDDGAARAAAIAERAFLRRLEGGCQVPIAAHAEIRGDSLTLRGQIAALDGSRIVANDLIGPTHAADHLGSDLAERLLAHGGRAILDTIVGVR